MNNKDFNSLLAKYYSGLTSVEEERWLKDNSHLLPEPLPRLKLSANDPVMEWSFEEFLAQANKLPHKPAIKRVRITPWLKYAAAIVAIVMLAIALYSEKDKGKVFPKEMASVKVAVVQKKQEPAIPGVANKKTNPVNHKEISKPAIVKRKKRPVSTKVPTLWQKTEDIFIVVDGRSITEEGEKLAILQKSFNRLSGNMRQTLADVNNFPKLDFKFK